MKKFLSMITIGILIFCVIIGYQHFICSNEPVWIIKGGSSAVANLNWGSKTLEILSVLLGVLLLIFLKITWKMINFNWDSKDSNDKKTKNIRS